MQCRGQTFGQSVERGGTVAGLRALTVGDHPHHRSESLPRSVFLSGVFAGNPASQVVWNGSHNWSDGALKRDDTVLRVEGPQAFSQYNANFEDMWANG